MISAFPKIFALGTVYIKDIFSGPVEVTEKIDGSQLDFGRIGGELQIRSKGKVQYVDAPDSLFTEAVSTVLDLAADIPDDTIFYCEYLRKPRHNLLAYERIPRNHLALFGMSSPDLEFVSEHAKLSDWADRLGLDVVQLLHSGTVGSADDIRALLETQSMLGGCKVEGVVVKNYAQQLLIGGRPIPIAAGKFVSEKFKEVQKTGWKKEHTGRGRWADFCESYRTEARWQKAVQHMREWGELENSPRDIGKLIKEVQRDITEEEKANIQEVLWQQFGGDVLRNAIRGMPEWYKQQLMDGSFE
jgi:hypothetical protein